MANPDTFSVSLQYYANFRDQAGKSGETLQVSPGTNILQLYEIIQKKYALSLKFSNLRAAANDSFVSSAYTLMPNDDIVFIPPVGGG